MSTQVVECLRAHEYVGIFRLVIFVGPLVRHGEQEHLFVAEDILQIIKKVGSLLLLLKDDQVTGSNAFVNGGEQNGIQAAREALDSYGL